MRKRIICLIVAIVMCCSAFAGCNLVTFDQERDNNKVVISVASYEIKSPDGQKTYKTEESKIYKSNFKTVYNYYAYSYQKYYGYTADQVVELLVENLATERIVLNLANAYIDFGYISIDTYDRNTIDKNVYTAIDSAVSSARTEILEERGITVTEDDDDHDHDHDDDNSSDSDTTYPVKDTTAGAYDSLTRDELVEICIARGLVNKPATDAEQDALDAITARQLKDRLIKDDRKNVEKWTPSLSRYPGLNAYDEESRSLELESLKRALKNIKKVVLASLDITDEQAAKVEEEYKHFEDVTNQKGLSYVYGELQGTTTAYLYAGKTYEDQQKLTLLEDYITGTVEVTRADVEAVYASTLAAQKSSYADETAYEKAISGDTKLLYFPDSNHFFVKHVLIPFSTAQTAALTAYKNSVEATVNGNYEDYRARLANEIMSYEHVDGEDFGSPISVNTIYNEIVNKVNGASTLYEKERAFDDLIYKYNTDPGIFGKTYGYMEKYELGSSTESYMAEFAAAARKLYEGGVEGAISGKVVTDYGVHVLYLSKLPKAGEVVGLDDYYSYGKYNSVYSAMEETALTAKESAAFSQWRSLQIARYYKGDAENAGVVTVNEKETKSVI